MLYGIEPVREALRARRRELRRLHLRQGRDDERARELRDLAAAAGVDVEAADNHQLARLAGDRHHQGAVLDCGALPTLGLDELLARALPARALLLALDQVEDPQNLGSLARSARFLGACGLLLHRSRSAPLSPAASKASAGALESLPVVVEANLARSLDRLRGEFWRVLGADGGEGSSDYREEPGADRMVLVMGSEGSGLRRLTRDKCDVLLRIPPAGGFESLNVSVAGGILVAQLLGGR